MKQIITFVVVGGSAALTHFLGLLAAVELFQMTALWGNLFGFGCAFLVSFYGHLNLTFRQQYSKDIKEIVNNLWRWFAISLLGFGLNQLLFFIGIQWWTERYYIVIWFFVTLAVTAVTFLSGKLWAFSNKNNGEL